MRSQPIISSSIEERLSRIERRLAALGKPHDLVSEMDVGVADVEILSTDAINTWLAFGFGFVVVIRGTHIYATYSDNQTTKSGQQIEFRYAQQEPSPATAEIVLLSTTIPLASSSPTFTYDIDVSGISPEIIGTRGRIQMYTKRNAVFGGGDFVYAGGRLSMGE